MISLNLTGSDISTILGATIAAVATLAGVALTSLFALRTARQTANDQNQRKDKEFRIAKLEDLYLLFDKWKVYLISTVTAYEGWHEGSVDATFIATALKDYDIYAPGDYQRFRLILELYFPELLEPYKKIELSRAQMAKLMCPPEKRWHPPESFDVAIEAFDEAAEDFKKSMVDFAQSSVHS